MILVDVSELLAGESLLSPGGLVDRETAQAADVMLWAIDLHTEVTPAKELVLTAVELDADAPELVTV